MPGECYGLSVFSNSNNNFLMFLCNDGVYIGINCTLALNRCAEKGAQTLPECSVGELSSISEKSKPIQLLLIVAGIATVVLGAECLVNAAVNMMKTFGVSEKFIGLTIVAFGTSLPELATSVVAAMKGEMDIGIGNLIGSNFFFDPEAKRAVIV